MTQTVAKKIIFIYFSIAELFALQLGFLCRISTSLTFDFIKKERQIIKRVNVYSKFTISSFRMDSVNCS